MANETVINPNVPSTEINTNMRGSNVTVINDDIIEQIENSDKKFRQKSVKNNVKNAIYSYDSNLSVENTTFISPF